MLNESDLEPLFSAFGRIYEMILYLTPAGSSTGVAFVRFTREDHARLAISVLHGYEILPGQHINVHVSDDTRILRIEDVPPELPTIILEEEFRSSFRGVQQVVARQENDDEVGK